MRQTTAPIFIIVRLLFMSFDQRIWYENRHYFSFVGVKVHRSLRQSKQEKKSLNCPWLPPLFRLWPLVNYLVYFTTSSLRNHYEWERVLDHVWEDGLCKIHSMKCSKLCFCLACSKLCFCLAPAKRKVVPPQLRGPSPPLPLRNFGPLTFHPNTS